MSWRWAAGALCAASGLALPTVLAAQDANAQCHAAEQQGGSAAAATGAAAERELAALADWLRQQGADVEAIQFTRSDKDEGRYGVYATEAARRRARRGWLGTAAGWVGWGRDAPISVAAFPAAHALTAANLAQHPQQGAVLRELQQLGLVDERTAVILHLAVERLRLRQARQQGSGPSSSSGSGSSSGGSGEAHGLLPWLALLPDDFGTTLYFSELDLQWLRGTTLHKATRLRQKSLLEAWSRLRPAAQQLAEQSGLAGAPSFEDWAWANSVFWSRAIAFPTPAPGGGVEVQEGIVPGLDFCNHASPSPCFWTVSAAAATLGKAGKASTASSSSSQGVGAVRLVCPRRAVPAAGQEVTIDYGGKSNEELMFLYGFAIRDNPAEVLTLMCPLPPPGEWDELLHARLALLSARDLRPQLHLPAADLPRLGAVEAEKDAAAVKRGSSKAGGAASGRAGGSDASVLASDLPEHVLETLEVFVMPAAQVAAELEAADTAGAAGAAGSTSGGGSSSSKQQQQQQQGDEEERSGQRMALLTTLVRLLELKVLEMEGQEGTGPLEADEQLLASAGDVLPRNQKHALLYRMGQKALARAYLVHAKRLLEQEMAHLARLQGRRG
ncbi:hypothetical protein ABPG75_009737 [Micractinium tetrahymenae]